MSNKALAVIHITGREQYNHKVFDFQTRRSVVKTKQTPSGIKNIAKRFPLIFCDKFDNFFKTKDRSFCILLVIVY